MKDTRSCTLENMQIREVSGRQFGMVGCNWHSGVAVGLFIKVRLGGKPNAGLLEPRAHIRELYTKPRLRLKGDSEMAC